MRYSLCKVLCFLTIKFLSHDSVKILKFESSINHFTVVCLVAWSLNESEAGLDLVVIETSLLFFCKFLLISVRTASLA